MPELRLPPAIPAQTLAEHTIPGIDWIHGAWPSTARMCGSPVVRNDLHCVEPDTGKLVRELARRDGDAGLAFDGQHLWQFCGDEIHQIDRTTGQDDAQDPGTAR